MSLTPPQSQFLHFIKERENARIAKEHGIHPHSNDPIIRDYKFCNINREHDRVTQWVKENVRDNPVAAASKTKLVLNLAVARVFNHPPTLEAILPMADFSATAKKLHALKARQKVFRGAYKMPAHGSQGIGGSAIDYFLSGLREIALMDFRRCMTLEQVATLIQNARGFGPFLANQIVTDLRYTPHFAEAQDWETFVLCGPGTKKGLCRFHSKPPKKGGSQKVALFQLQHAQEILEPHLRKPFTEYFRDPNNLTNSFCEFSKYARADQGGATPKSKYQPHNGIHS